MSKTAFTFVPVSSLKAIEEQGKRYLKVDKHHTAVSLEIFDTIENLLKRINDSTAVNGKPWFEKQDYAIMEVTIPDSDMHLFMKYVLEVDGGNLWSAFPGKLEILDSFIYTKK